MELLALDLLSLLATLLGSVSTGNFSNDTASTDRKSNWCLLNGISG